MTDYKKNSKKSSISVVKVVFLIFFLYLVAVYVLLLIPGLRRYLSLFYTFIHELSHSLTSLLTGGGISRIRLFANTEGEATTLHTHWLSAVLTILSGYLLASLASIGFWMLLIKKEFELCEWIIGGLLVIAILLWIRNLYGIYWGLLFGGVLSFFSFFEQGRFIAYFLYLLASILSIESVRAPYSLWRLIRKQPKAAGDASLLSNQTHIPSIVWGTFFCIFATACFVYTLYLLLVIK